MIDQRHVNVALEALRCAPKAVVMAHAGSDPYDCVHAILTRSDLDGAAKYGIDALPVAYSALNRAHPRRKAKEPSWMYYMRCETSRLQILQRAARNLERLIDRAAG